MTQEFIFRLANEGKPNGPSVLMADAAETRGAYIFRVNEIVPPGRWVAPHIHHAEEEAWFITSGEITFHVADKELQAPTGTFILVPRGVPHDFGNAGAESASFVQIFSPPGMEGYFDERDALARQMKGREGLDFAGLDPELHRVLAERYHMEFV